MPESLLSFSAILLFGRKLDDIEIVADSFAVPDATKDAVVFTRRNLPSAAANVRVKGKVLQDDQNVLVKHRKDDAKTGLKKLTNDGAGNYTWESALNNGDTVIVRVEYSRKKRGEFWNVEQVSASKSKVSRIKSVGRGKNTFVGEQLDEDACFARIYGFTYEGDYFDLPSPTLFLVHGDGELVSQEPNTGRPAQMGIAFPSNVSRAPRDPSLGGMGAANFQFADDIRVWDYDKSDYTIRMDVCTGMFEQVLLDATLGDGSFGVSGAKVSGAKVSGAKVSGAKVSGAKVSGAKARGPSD